MSPNLAALMVFLGLAATLGFGVFAFAGDGGGNRLSKRLEAVRERHSNSREVAAKAQMKRIVAARDDRLESALKQFIPRRAELRSRLERTGRDITVGKYAAACGGIALAMLAAGLMVGAPLPLSLLVALFAGLGLPHFAVGFLIAKRINQFTTRFPDAIDLLVRGLRSGLPVTESIGVVRPRGAPIRSASNSARSPTRSRSARRWRWRCRTRPAVSTRQSSNFS